MPTYADDIKTGSEELTKKWKDRELGPFKVLKVDSVNHRPHPFVIGPRHVALASDHYSGRLGMEVIRRIPCAQCKDDAKAHSFDVVMMVKLTRNATNAEANEALKAVCDEISADGIDGFAFVETPEKFRFT